MLLSSVWSWLGEWGGGSSLLGAGCKWLSDRGEGKEREDADGALMVWHGMRNNFRWHFMAR